MTAPTDPASPKARAALVLSLQAAGCADAVEQRRVCAVWVGRPIASRTELTEREARSLAARLRTMTREELAAVLARPAPQPEAPPIVGEPELDGALRSELEDTAEPDQPAHVGPPYPPLAPTEEEWERHQETLRPAEPVLVEPPPDDVEAAVEAAAARFRERVATGIVPEPPDLSSLPPRTPVILGPPPDRYCLAVCYCGTCEHWAPVPPVDYSKTPGSIAYEESERWRR